MRRPSPGEGGGTVTGGHPDPARQSRDEQTFDALARFELPAEPDEVVSLLAAWRDELSAVPPGQLDLDAVTPARTPRRTLRPRRFLAGALAALALAGGAGGAALASADSRPGDLLWPVTRLIYPDRADSLVAASTVEGMVTEARQAALDRRFEEAVRLLDQADPLLSRVLEPAEQQELRDEIAAVRELIRESLDLGLLPRDAPEGDAATDEAGDPDNTPVPIPAPPAAPSPAGEPSPEPDESSEPVITPSLPLPSISLPPILPGGG